MEVCSHGHTQYIHASVILHLASSLGTKFSSGGQQQHSDVTLLQARETIFSLCGAVIVPVAAARRPSRRPRRVQLVVVSESTPRRQNIAAGARRPGVARRESAARSRCAARTTSGTSAIRPATGTAMTAACNIMLPPPDHHHRDFHRSTKLDDEDDETEEFRSSSDNSSVWLKQFRHIKLTTDLVFRHFRIALYYGRK